MKIRQKSEIQRNKNKTFSIKISRLINVVAKIIDKITNLLFFTAETSQFEKGFSSM
jgi:hypothetical protein